MSRGASVAVGKAVTNLIHASGNREEAAQEVELWFAKDELFDHKTLAKTYIY